MTTTTHEQAVENAVALLEEKKPTKKPRGRQAVPAATPSSPRPASRALDELTGAAARIEMIPLDRLHPHPDNPRRDVGDVTELADSIRAHGVRQNLLVVPDPDDADAFRLVIGHRRTAAARVAGAAALPAVVDATLSPADQLELMLLENLQRVDLSAVEEADAYQGLLDLGLDEKAIAERTGRARSTVKSRLRLRALPEKAREAVHHHEITLDDAAALGNLPDADQDRLVKVLGTPNFDATLARVRAEADQRARWQPMLDALTAANATELERDTWTTPEGSTQWFAPDLPEDTTVAERLTVEIAAGWSWRWMYGQIKVYRPYTLEETQQRAQQDERAAQLQEERAAETAKNEAARAARHELASITATTRREFLQHLIHDRKALTKDQHAALVDYAADVITDAPWTGRYLDGQYQRRPQTPQLTPLLQWLRVDHDPQALASLGYNERESEDARLRGVAAEAAATLPAPQRLLAALAAGFEPLDGDAWRNAAGNRTLVRWYALLEQLGYTPSDEERAALAPAPADVDEAA